MIGKIRRRPLREVWKHEAIDFTKWLEENIDVLNDILDLQLSDAVREQNAGDFSVDLVAKDGDGQTVIIENQLERSDHDHLGKLITYLAAMNAKAAIWIVSDPRPEHASAVTWLNQSRAAFFYLLKVEAIQIGDSPAAPLLTLIVGPSAEGHQVGDVKRELEESEHRHEEFWRTLLGRAKAKTKLFSSISPSANGWISAGSGLGGVPYTFAVWQHSGGIEIYIDRGKDSEAENNKVFDTLSAAKAKIEGVFGEPLEWQRLEGKKACRIRRRFDGCGWADDPARWPESQDVMIDAMVRLERAVGPYLANLRRDGV